METNTNKTPAAASLFQWKSQEAFRDADVYGCLGIALAEGATSSDEVRTFATMTAAMPVLPVRWRTAYAKLAANCV